MEFRRSSHRDGRRRRVLVDEVAQSVKLDQPTDSFRSAAPKYTDAARANNQLRITDLIPRSRWTLCGLFALGVAAITAIEILHLQVPRWSSAVTGKQLAAFDLAAPNNLATWLSSFLLALTSVMSLVIFSIRRHRSDDYRGRYNMWVWASGFSLLASIDAVAGLRHVVAGMVFYVTNIAPLNDIAVWWMLVWGATCGALSVRIIRDIWTSRLATMTLVASVIAYLGTVLVRLNAVSLTHSQAAILLQSGFLLSGHFLLTFSWCLYARRVYLEAEGTETSPAFPQKSRGFGFRKRRMTNASSAALPTVAGNATHNKKADNGPKDSRVQKPETRKERTVEPTVTQPVAQATPKAEGSSWDSRGTETKAKSDLDRLNLSKAERRRLRRLKRKEKNAA